MILSGGATSFSFIVAVTISLAAQGQIQQMGKDSIKVLAHEEFIQYGSKQLRKVFLDYKRHSQHKKEYYEAESRFLKPDWGSIVSYPRPEGIDFVVNSNRNLLKTYISISKLNGSYVFFSADGVDSNLLTLAYVKDSTITFLNLQSWVVNYYKNITKTNKKITIDLFDPSKTNIEIKIIDEANDIQIWKTTETSTVGEVSIHYELKAPLPYALKLPILVISNTVGLDTSYEGLDDLNLEKLFNQ